MLHADQFRELYRDTVRTHAGQEITYSHASAPSAAFVVPLTDAGEIVLLQQYRYPVDRWMWEVPAGRIEAESPEDTARRELREEVGGVAAAIQPLGTFFTATAHLNMQCHAFLATGVRLDHPHQHESTELMQMHVMSVEDAFSLARTGGDVEAQSMLVILMAQPLIERLQTAHEAL